MASRHVENEEGFFCFINHLFNDILIEPRADSELTKFPKLEYKRKYFGKHFQRLMPTKCG